jgi:hypothetical protein
MPVFENRSLCKIFGPGREDVTGQRKLHNEGLHDVLFTRYYSDEMKDEMGMACGMYGGEQKCTQGFGGEP